MFHDAAVLVARAGIGGIFFANGWQKLEAGLNATTEEFARIDAPLPYAWAAVTMLVELLGGAMVVAGFAVPVCGILLFVEALAVFALAAGDPARPLTGASANLVVALCAGSLLLAVVGAGRISVDHMVVIKRRDTGREEEPALDPEAEADEVLAALRGPRQASGEIPAGPEQAGTGSAESGPSATRKADGDADPQDKGASEGATQPIRARKGRQRRADAGTAEGAEKEDGGTETTGKTTAGKGTTAKGDTLVAGRKENPSG
ncbi:hypothetical protein GCM10010106_24400 [Thermopolyspora flexuosa]|jgi:putative oxidoreductase|uniref:Putative oxidoreductase n=1 Tax=Thermopolyspora flexuosa TaxID=103836 RepID=A0A543IVE9_9ACTN|nr:DoxX family protein [Thermopolyspora flexuosa]TQM74552.1 putative oxidoreductase [Thermopolyspora flexuosa]GGM77059.1 hypothetical protein GCM10010106_24400 [Thermopolyspora flexuosa]